MHQDPKRGQAEIPEFKIERPARTKEPVPGKEKKKMPEALSAKDHASLVQFIVDQRKAMDKGLDETEVQKTNVSLAEKEQEIEALKISLEAIRLLKDETEALRARQQKRERSFFGGIAETFSPTVYPTIELNGRRQNMQEILSHLYADMKIVFLNIDRTPFPDDDVSVSVMGRALRDAGVQMMLGEKLKGLNTTLSQEGVLDLFQEADQSSDLTPSQEQMNVLHAREDALLKSFNTFKSEMEQLMKIKIGKDKHGNMKIIQNR